MGLDSINIGLIGAGGNVKLRHIPGFQAIDGVNVTAVSNRSIASGKKIAEELSLIHI